MNNRVSDNDKKRKGPVAILRLILFERDPSDVVINVRLTLIAILLAAAAIWFLNNLISEHGF